MTSKSEALPVSELGEHARSHLDWDELVRSLVRESPSRAATRALEGLMPSVDPAEARQRLLRTEETLELYAHGETIPTFECPDTSELVLRLRRGVVASALELGELLLLLSYASELRIFARSVTPRAPSIAAAVTSDAVLGGLERELRRSIDDGSAITDAASPGLARARAQAMQRRAALQKELSSALRRHASVMRDGYYTEWEGRYVLPVRSDSYQRALGIVLGSSASGGTLYVEPPEVTELSSQWKLAQTEVLREEEKVLVHLSREAELLSEPLEQAVAATVHAGLLIAIARWAARTESRAVRLSDDSAVDLRAMRHPLMLGKGFEVVPNDLTLDRGSALIMSGPNAGGKTVALKCLGLAVWMVKAGLPLPVAAGSKIGWFDCVLTDFGDQQSLSQSLSTFSAHIRMLRSMLAHATPETLVLIDEVAAGTDPQEGSTLAAAVLEELVSKGAAVAVTTHYELLKELAARAPHFINASMVFDFQKMLPTFNLAIGVPGRSSALLVAARYGIPASVLARAEALLPRQAIERERAVALLDAERQALSDLRRTLLLDQARHAELLAAAERERNAARAAERARLSRETEALTASVRQARAALEDAKKRVTVRKLDRATLKETERAVSEAARQLGPGSELHQATQAPKEASPKPAPPESLVSGAPVYLFELGQYGTVLEPPRRGQLSVRIGSVTLSLAAASVALDTRPDGARKERARTPSAPERTPSRALGDTSGPAKSPRTSDVTLDLRGVRVEAGLEQVDEFIDSLLRRGQAQGFVLHGHGTGAMKNAVREHLRSSRCVTAAEPAEPGDGGDAFTVFWLRD